MSPGWDAAVLREGGLVLDLIDGPPGAGPALDAALGLAVRRMAELEAGAIANPDEGRQVGHYWLRAPELAPDPQQRSAIEASWAAVDALDGGDHEDVLLIGIGGSALGPQLLREALVHPGDRRRLHVLDNTDPEGISDLLGSVDPRRTLVVVASKSGGTAETRNGMLAAMAWKARAGLPWGPSAIAITTEGSALDRLASAADDPWRARLPLWDWVGGRTSLTGAIGLVPMALCGWDWRALLDGAAEMDRATRVAGPHNPALRLAAAWYTAGGGRGDRALVVLPYRDRLSLFGRYLQQLIMESIGKRLDLGGAEVFQGLTVYGNKGSTDQHAFVQQLRDGRDDALVHFLDTEAQGPRVPVDGGLFADDHLIGFLLGTRAALRSAGRPSVTIRARDVGPRSVGALVALFERAVGFYADLVGVNAYHQPGVEAGKRGARAALDLLNRLLLCLSPEPQPVDALASQAGGDPATCWRLLDHLAATGRASRTVGTHPAADRYASIDSGR